MKKIAVFFWLAICATGCAPSAPEPGVWRAVVELPGGEMPFTIDFNGEGDSWQAVVINGAERVEVPEVALSSDEMTLVFPAFNTRIDAQREGDGYAGTLTLVKRHGKLQVMPFRASHGDDYRFVADANGDVDVSGRWSVTFTEDDGTTSEAVAEFEQQGSEVTGTFLTPTGDYRFLAGDLHDGRMHLSTFDGAHAFLFSADVTDDGSLAGDFWSGTEWHESWTAQRDAAAALPDANSMTRFVGDQVAFAFPNTDGEVVTFDDPRFRDKVVLITLAGSWCPNCHDEAAFMAPFYQQYRDRGLEIVGLMFEHLDDFDEAARQVDQFRKKFGIEYTLLVAGSSDKQRAGEVMPMLDRVYAFPTTIFVDRAGTVRRVHTGWTGPGTGSHYEELVADLTRSVENLLAEE